MKAVAGNTVAGSIPVLSAIFDERYTMSLRKPIRFCSFGSYRPLTRFWWCDLLWYATGVSISHLYAFGDGRTRWRKAGWYSDLHAYWHRARYGWAPRDTWSLDGHLNDVLAGTLEYLADHTHGCPQSYVVAAKPYDECREWNTDLRRWAHAFSEDPNDVTINDRSQNYAQQRAEEERRRQNIHVALKEIEPVWESLWD